MKEFKINNLNNVPLNIIEGKHIDNPLAIIINVHGISSHFQEFYKSQDNLEFRDNFFTNESCKSYGLEFHGHGKSDGIRCSISKFDNLVDDLYCLVKYVYNIYKNIPVFIIAESMGGAVAIKYNIKYQFHYPIKSYILLAPMCGIDDRLKPNFLAIYFLITMSYYFPTYPALNTNSKMRETCKNLNYEKARQECKYNYHGKMRLNTARECYHTSLWIKEYGKLFNAPLFLIHGINDKITNPQMSIQFYNQVPNKNKKIYLPKNTDHSVLLPNNKDDTHPEFILNEIKEWIKNLLKSN